MPLGGALAKLRGAVEKVATEKATSDGRALPSFMRPTAAAAQNQNKQKFEYKVRERPLCISLFLRDLSQRSSLSPSLSLSRSYPRTQPIVFNPPAPTPDETFLPSLSNRM
jgi:hypothetical protein